MSRTVKHPPKPDRFTRRDRTGAHAKERKMRDEVAKDFRETLERVVAWLPVSLPSEIDAEIDRHFWELLLPIETKSAVRQ